MEDFPSTFLEKYKVVEELGSRHGTVFKARELDLNRIVTVKFFSPGLFEGDEAHKRFINEGKLLARLRHTNIVDVFDVEDDVSWPYIVMEFIEGFSLKNEIARMGTIPIRHACSYMLQVAEGMSFLHSEGMIHRNLKPKNILIDRYGVVKLLDFGFAQPQGGSAVDGGSGRVLGTPAYMSPEQALGDKLDCRTDIYSAGVIFFELLCGTVPFWGGSAKDIMRAHVEEEVPSIREFNPVVPRDLRKIVRRMLAKDFKIRYDTFNKVSRDLKRFLARDDWEQEVEKAREEVERLGAEALKAKTRARRLARKKKRRKRRRSRPEKDLSLFRNLGLAVLVIVVLAIGAGGAGRLMNFAGMTLGLGVQPDSVRSRLAGRILEIRWESEKAYYSRIRMVSPFPGRYFENRQQGRTKKHVVYVSDISDGELVRFNIVMPGDLMSREFQFVTKLQQIITAIKPDVGITEVVVSVETSRPTLVSLAIGPTEEGAMRSWTTESSKEAKTHTLSIQGIPANTEFVGKVTVKWEEAWAGDGRTETFWEEGKVRFTTLEPTFRRIFTSPEGDIFHPQPVMLDDNILLGCDDGKLYCVASKDGQLIWKAFIGGPVRGSAVLKGDFVFSVGRRGRVVCLEKDSGRLVWRYASGKTVVGGLVLHGGDIFVAADDGTVLRIDATKGTLVWTADTGVAIETEVAVDDKAVYVGDVGGQLLALSRNNARRLWARRTGNRIAARPELCDRFVLLPGMDDHLYAINRRDGVVSWRKRLGSIPGGLTLVQRVGGGKNGKPSVILFCALTHEDKNRLLCANAVSGSTFWVVDVPSSIGGRVAVSENRVYAGGSDGKVYCFDASNGIRLWSVDTGSEIRGGPVASDGVVFVANYHGCLFRIED